MFDGLSSSQKQQFLAKMRAERARWDELLAEAVRAAQRRTEAIPPHIAGDWSLQDVIAHVTATEQGLIEWLEAAADGRSVALGPLDVDEPEWDLVDDAIYASRAHLPLPELLDESADTFRRLVALVDRWPEQDLVDAERTDWFVRPRWGRAYPLWECIASDSYRHYGEHAPAIRAWLEQRR